MFYKDGQDEQDKEAGCYEDFFEATTGEGICLTTRNSRLKP